MCPGMSDYDFAGGGYDPYAVPYDDEDLDQVSGANDPAAEQMQDPADPVQTADSAAPKSEDPHSSVDDMARLRAGVGGLRAGIEHQAEAVDIAKRISGRGTLTLEGKKDLLARMANLKQTAPHENFPELDQAVQGWRDEVVKQLEDSQHIKAHPEVLVELLEVAEHPAMGLNDEAAAARIDARDELSAYTKERPEIAMRAILDRVQQMRDVPGKGAPKTDLALRSWRSDVSSQLKQLDMLDTDQKVSVLSIASDAVMGLRADALAAEIHHLDQELEGVVREGGDCGVLVNDLLDRIAQFRTDNPDVHHDGLETAFTEWTEKISANLERFEELSFIEQREALAVGGDPDAGLIVKMNTAWVENWQFEAETRGVAGPYELAAEFSAAVGSLDQLKQTYPDLDFGSMEVAVGDAITQMRERFNNLENEHDPNAVRMIIQIARGLPQLGLSAPDVMEAQVRHRETLVGSGVPTGAALSFALDLMSSASRESSPTLDAAMDEWVGDIKSLLERSESLDTQELKDLLALANSAVKLAKGGNEEMKVALAAAQLNNALRSNIGDDGAVSWRQYSDDIRKALQPFNQLVASGEGYPPQVQAALEQCRQEVQEGLDRLGTMKASEIESLMRLAEKKEIGKAGEAVAAHIRNRHAVLENMAGPRRRFELEDMLEETSRYLEQNQGAVAPAVEEAINEWRSEIREKLKDLSSLSQEDQKLVLMQASNQALSLEQETLLARMSQRDELFGKRGGDNYSTLTKLLGDIHRYRMKNPDADCAPMDAALATYTQILQEQLDDLLELAPQDRQELLNLIENELSLNLQEASFVAQVREREALFNLGGDAIQRQDFKKLNSLLDSIVNYQTANPSPASEALTQQLEDLRVEIEGYLEHIQDYDEDERDAILAIAGKALLGVDQAKLRQAQELDEAIAARGQALEAIRSALEEDYEEQLESLEIVQQAIVDYDGVMNDDLEEAIAALRDLVAEDLQQLEDVDDYDIEDLVAVSSHPLLAMETYYPGFVAPARSRMKEVEWKQYAQKITSSRKQQTLQDQLHKLDRIQKDIGEADLKDPAYASLVACMEEWARDLSGTLEGSESLSRDDLLLYSRMFNHPAMRPHVDAIGSSAAELTLNKLLQPISDQLEVFTDLAHDQKLELLDGIAQVAQVGPHALDSVEDRIGAIQLDLRRSLDSDFEAMEPRDKAQVLALAKHPMISRDHILSLNADQTLHRLFEAAAESGDLNEVRVIAEQVYVGDNAFEVNTDTVAAKAAELGVSLRDRGVRSPLPVPSDEVATNLEGLIEFSPAHFQDIVGVRKVPDASPDIDIGDMKGLLLQIQAQLPILWGDEGRTYSRGHVVEELNKRIDELVRHANNPKGIPDNVRAPVNAVRHWIVHVRQEDANIEAELDRETRVKMALDLNEEMLQVFRDCLAPTCFHCIDRFNLEAEGIFYNRVKGEADAGVQEVLAVRVAKKATVARADIFEAVATEIAHERGSQIPFNDVASFVRVAREQRGLDYGVPKSLETESPYTNDFAPSVERFSADIEERFFKAYDDRIREIVTEEVFRWEELTDFCADRFTDLYDYEESDDPDVDDTQNAAILQLWDTSAGKGNEKLSSKGLALVMQELHICQAHT